MKNSRKLASLSLSARGLRNVGYVLLGSGCVGSLIQRQLLGVGQLHNEELLALLSELPHGMAYATLSVICQVLEHCAVPIFAFLLTEGARHSENFLRYLLRVLILALACEIPYNLFTAGTLLDIGECSPVLGAVMTLAMLWFFRRFTEKKLSHRLIKLLAVLGAFLWSSFLGAAYGAPCVLIAAALWLSGSRQNLRLLIGGAASMACSVFSPLFLFTPFAFLFLYLYNGEGGQEGKRLHYLVYPILLTACCLLLRVAG